MSFSPNDIVKMPDGTFRLKKSVKNIKEKSSKYRSRKIEFEGEKYDSKKEYCRHGELKFLLKIGEITDLKRQVIFELSVCKYIADYCYKDKTGAYIVEDVKSRYTRQLPVYRLKKKMMFKELGIKIKEG